MKLFELRKLSINKLLEEGIERPIYFTDLILSKILAANKATLITKYEEEVSPHLCKELLFMVEQRLKRMPLSYIIGEAEFYGRKFKVGTGCLIPRPETELLVEEMLKPMPDVKLFADWCTGSACIGITLLLEKSNCSGYGIDSSALALEWAMKNVDFYNLQNRFKLICNSEPSKCNIKDKSLDFIIFNPPYIPTSDIDILMKDVKDFEPREALDGGEDGLDVLIKIIKIAPKFIKPQGYIGFETAGNIQIDKIHIIMQKDFKLLKNIYDYNGILRHMIWQLL